MIRVEPLIHGSISSLIFSTCGPMLNAREADMFNYCQLMGQVYLGYVDGDFVCCWGLIPPSFLSYHAYLWMWASPKLTSHQFVFVRQSQRQVEAMLKQYESIVGHCVQQNGSAIRWLRWLGAEFDYPSEGLVSFTIRRK